MVNGIVRSSRVVVGTHTRTSQKQSTIWLARHLNGPIRAKRIPKLPLMSAQNQAKHAPTIRYHRQFKLQILVHSKVANNSILSATWPSSQNDNN